MLLVLFLCLAALHLLWHHIVSISNDETMTIENFTVATTFTCLKCKRKLTGDQANLKYPKTKLTKALVCFTSCACIYKFTMHTILGTYDYQWQ